MVYTLGLTLKYQKFYGYVHVPLSHYRLPRQEEVGGVILSGTFDSQYIRMYQSEGVPVVVADYWVQNPPVDCVAVDVEAEANMAVEYLADRGHTSLGFLATGRREWNSDLRTFDPDIARLLGYLRKAGAERGLQMRNEWIILAPTDEDRQAART